MRKTAFAEEQIAYALREVEAGTSVAEMSRKLGVTQQTQVPCLSWGPPRENSRLGDARTERRGASLRTGRRRSVARQPFRTRMATRPRWCDCTASTARMRKWTAEP
jgi:hypothetical protein